MTKPVAVFQHSRVGHPGAALDVLDDLGIAWQLVPIVDGAPVPCSVSGFSGVVLMGGYMGVNDDLPWIREEIAFIRAADQSGLPVVGHCLGAQLLAAALGATVRRTAVPEFGWHDIEIGSTSEATEWFGCAAGDRLPVFQWHGDTFDLPERAVRVASSPWCENQAFVHGGRHLGMQFHLEMTADLIHQTLERNGHQLRRQFESGHPAARSEEDVLADLPARTAAMHGTLRKLYRRWAQNLVD